MSKDQIEVTLPKEKLGEIMRAYKVLGEFLESVLPREEIYKATFMRGLDDALQEVETRQTRKIASFDEFIK